MYKSSIILVFAASCRFTAPPAHAPVVYVGVPFQATVTMGKSYPEEAATAWGCVGHPLGWTATATTDASGTLSAQDPVAVVNKPALPGGDAWTCWDLGGLYTTVIASVVLTPASEGAATLTWFVESQAGTGSDVRTSTVTVRPSDADLDGALSVEAGGDDCDDQRGDVFPGAAESCDGADNDCDGAIDDAVADAPAWFFDADLDGAGDDTSVVTRCEAPGPGWTAVGGDCDDVDDAVRPGAPEACDVVDNDCDGVVDDGAPDADADGVCDAFDLMLASTPVVPGGFTTWTLSNATPGANAALLLARTSGGAPRCLPGSTLADGAPACVDLVRPVTFGPTTVGQDGTASWTVRVPTSLPVGATFFGVGATWLGASADLTDPVPFRVE